MKNNQYFSGLHLFAILFISILLIPCSISAYKTINGFKFFEQGKVVETENGNFEFPKIKDYNEIIPLELTPCFIDSVIFTDVFLARDIWEARGDTLTEEESDGRRILYINLTNFPREYNSVDSTEMDSLNKTFGTTILSDRPDRLNFSEQAKNFYKTGRNVIYFDYALCKDSLVISVYKYEYSFNKKKSVIKKLNHLNFIHKYNCTENEWELSDVTETKDYFPEIYRSDYLRESILDDLRTYLSTYHRYKRWCMAKWFPEENYTISDTYQNTYLNSFDFPTGVLDNFTDSLYQLPREYYYLNPKEYRTLNKRIFKDSKKVLKLEYKLKGDSLIVHFHLERHSFNAKENFFDITTSSLGYFVHRYDCDTRRWKRIFETFYVY